MLGGLFPNILFAAALIVVVVSTFLLFLAQFQLPDSPGQRSKKRSFLIIFFVGISGGLLFWQNHFDLLRTKMFCYLALYEYSWFIVPLSIVLGTVHLVFWNVICPRYLWPRTFESQAWKTADPFERTRMVEDLLARGLLEHLSGQEVIALLGEPEKKIDNLWEFRIGEHACFSLIFDKNKKVGKIERVVPREPGHEVKW